MPYHLGAIGGMFDEEDLDSSVTAKREICEETGMNKDTDLNLLKFD